MAIRRLDVDVDGIFLIGGRFEPRAIRLYKEHAWLPIVKCEAPQRAANRNVGGAGFRYQVQVLMGISDGASIKRSAALWREEDKWFVEEEVQEEVG